LIKAGWSSDWLDRIANTLQRVVGPPEAGAARAYTNDNRFVLLASKQLWIVTGDFSSEKAMELTVQTVHLTDEPHRCSLSEAYNLYGNEIIYTWRFEFDGISEPLEFEARGEYVRGLESPEPNYHFGWQLATAIGWTKPS
jgi:hypothetical protein